MYKPYSRPVTAASPDVKVAHPVISKLALFILKIIAKPYILLLFGPAKIVLHDEKILFDIFNEPPSGNNRTLIAFRHPDGRESQLLAWFFIFKLRKLAAKKGIHFTKRPHVIFVYGYEVARWGGKAARLVMPKIGAIPIHHSKLDSKGMARIYDSIHNGPYPLALAPEGQVSYSTDTVPRLETGVIRIGFQAAQTNENCSVRLLPLSIHFRYGKRGRKAMEKLLGKIEKTCGFFSKDTSPLSLEERLSRCRNKILEINEERYNIKNESLSFEERHKKVVDAALVAAERMLGIKSEGDFFTRLYKVRHICWDRIYLPDVENFDGVSKAKRSLLDISAGEAWHIARHQELADFGWYFSHPLPKEDSALHVKVQYVQNLFDYASRTMGGAIADRKYIPSDKIIIKPAPVIELSARLCEYKKDRKRTIENTKNDLEKAYLDCIEQVNKTEF